jgi:hypothetical protein
LHQLRRICRLPSGNRIGAMFGPEIYGISSATLLAYSQALLTPAAGFVFIYLLGLPLKEIAQLPKVNYTPPAWVVPVFANVVFFAFVLTGACAAFLNFWHENSFAANIKTELFLERTLDLSAKQPTRLSVVLRSYDSFSGFSIVANGYHVLSSNRDCATSFQCTADAAKAKIALEEFIEKRKSGGSLYELDRTNSLPHEVALNHYVHIGQNHLDIVSENSGTGSCEVQFDLVVADDENREQFALKIYPYRAAREGQEPKRKGPLSREEDFYSGGSVSGSRVERYNVSATERPYVVCERLRVAFTLSEDQFRRLSPAADFEAYFLARQKSHVCETMNKQMPGCEK